MQMMQPLNIRREPAAVLLAHFYLVVPQSRLLGFAFGDYDAAVIRPQRLPRSIYLRPSILPIHARVEETAIILHSMPIWWDFFDERCCDHFH